MKLIDKFTVQAPSRADLAGGTLDLWPLYCLVPEAQTINVALDLYASVDFEVYESAQFKLHVSAGEQQFSLYESWKLGALSAVPAVLQFPVFSTLTFLNLHQKKPALAINISIRSAVPMGSGLGGSSTLLVALGRGLCRITRDFSEQGWQWKFLDWAKDTEAAFLKVPTGTQDYLAAIFGGFQSYRFQPGKISQTPMSARAFQELNERLLIVFSGQRHHSGLSNWEVYKKAIEGDTKVLGGLNELAQVAKKVERGLYQESIDWNQLGQLMEEEWSVRKRTFQVSTPELEQVIDTVRSTGVLGVKVCGAAQGGSLLVLVEPPQKNQIKSRLQQQKLQVLSASTTYRGVSISESNSDMD
ncbi:hypothetical protein EBR03_05600 [bacterium]|nr:hypothetical protein [bacterium]